MSWDPGELRKIMDNSGGIQLWKLQIVLEMTSYHQCPTDNLPLVNKFWMSLFSTYATYYCSQRGEIQISTVVGLLFRIAYFVWKMTYLDSHLEGKGAATSMEFYRVMNEKVENLCR